MFISLYYLMPTGSFTVHFCNTYWVSNAEHHLAGRALGFTFPKVFLYLLHTCRAGLAGCQCASTLLTPSQAGQPGVSQRGILGFGHGSI